MKHELYDYRQTYSVRTLILGLRLLDYITHSASQQKL